MDLILDFGKTYGWAIDVTLKNQFLDLYNIVKKKKVSLPIWFLDLLLLMSLFGTLCMGAATACGKSNAYPTSGSKIHFPVVFESKQDVYG